jgi:hypothetical protein
MNLSFKKYKKLCYNVYNQIDKTTEYDAILCVLRGGVFLADFLQRKMHLPIYFATVSSYKNKEQQSPRFEINNLDKFLINKRVLLVDDIYDSGYTIKLLEDLFPITLLYPCVLISKQKKEGLIYGKYIRSKEWVNFWWEKI